MAGYYLRNCEKIKLKEVIVVARSLGFQDTGLFSNAYLWKGRIAINDNQDSKRVPMSIYLDPESPRDMQIFSFGEEVYNAAAIKVIGCFRNLCKPKVICSESGVNYDESRFPEIVLELSDKV